MKYILLIYGDERVWESMSPAEMEKAYEAHGAYGEAMEKAGVMRGGAELKPTTTATSLRFTGGKPKTFDGPFAETKEQLGGFYLIEVDNLEQAIEWAEKMPGMDSGTVEIRPLGME
ncbi:MAG: YciI family protein [Thermoanaerobaculia bacterium]